MSKTIVFVCRVIVVLAFVTTIPLIALFGDSLPDVAETVWSFWKKPVQENHWADAEEAPLFSPTASPAGPVNTSIPSYVPQPDNRVNLIGATAPIAPRYGNPTPPSAGPSPPTGTIPPIHQEVPSPLTANNMGTPSRFTNPPTASSAQPPLPQNSAFEQISRRLQQLGAMYYRLESWGNGKPLFRFQCRMAILGSTGLTRQFEATHQDPAEAMRQVLHQIESWQQSQPSAGRAQPPVGRPAQPPMVPPMVGVQPAVGQPAMVSDVRNAPNAPR